MRYGDMFDGDDANTRALDPSDLVDLETRNRVLNSRLAAGSEICRSSVARRCGRRGEVPVPPTPTPVPLRRSADRRRGGEKPEALFVNGPATRRLRLRAKRAGSHPPSPLRLVPC
eukprot:Selendium_serpulae@DN11996_c0_g1_i1.p2